MRNRKLRLLSLFLATVMMLGLLAGCNSSGGDDKRQGKGQLGGSHHERNSFPFSL